MYKTSNVSIRDFKKYLNHIGCKHIRTTGGHEHWTRSDLSRPITFQAHIDPIPEFIVKNALRGLNVDKKDFIETMEKIL
jgi:hypothetical protein